MWDDSQASIDDRGKTLLPTPRAEVEADMTSSGDWNTWPVVATYTGTWLVNVLRARGLALGQ